MAVYLGLASTSLNVLGNIPYAVEVWRGHAKPTLSTWTIWGGLDTLRFVAMFWAGIISYQMIGSIIGILIILAIGAWRGMLVPWAKSDGFIAAVIMVGMGASIHFGGTPWWVLLASLIAVTLGSLPMFWKTIKEPYSEPLGAWGMFWSAAVTQFLASPDYSFEAIAVPVWFGTLMTVLMLTIVARRQFVEKPPALVLATA